MDNKKIKDTPLDWFMLTSAMLLFLLGLVAPCAIYANGSHISEWDSNHWEVYATGMTVVIYTVVVAILSEVRK